VARREWGGSRRRTRETGADFDELMDEVALVCASDDEQVVAAMYARHDFAVPSTLSESD
jgi:hypothetical protein